MLELLGCDALGFVIGMISLACDIAGYAAAVYRQEHGEIDGHF